MSGQTTARFVFTNTDDPTKDELVRRAESRITLAKRGITTDINRAMDTKSSIERQVQRGIKKESSIVAGMMKTGSGYVEAATNSNTELELATDDLVCILEEIIVQNEDKKDEAGQ